jgi:hypothetical protein
MLPGSVGVACSPILSASFEGMGCAPVLNRAATPDEFVSMFSIPLFDIFFISNLFLLHNGQIVYHLDGDSSIGGLPWCEESLVAWTISRD